MKDLGVKNNGVSTVNPNSERYNPNNKTYSGKEFDVETESYYYGSRFYDPANGAWNKADSYRGEIKSPITRNRYGFVSDNPVNMVDMYGFCNSAISSCPTMQSKITITTQQRAIQTQIENNKTSQANTSNQISQINAILPSLYSKVLTTQSAAYKARIYYHDYIVMNGLTGRLMAKGYQLDYATVSNYVGNKIVQTGKEYSIRQQQYMSAQNNYYSKVQTRNSLSATLSNLQTQQSQLQDGMLALNTLQKLQSASNPNKMASYYFSNEETGVLNRISSGNDSFLNSLLVSTGVSLSRFVSTSISGTAFASTGDVFVYYGLDINGARVYVGITNNPIQRAIQHGDRFPNGLGVINEGNPFDRTSARGIEQFLKEKNPQFENKINSISESNPKYAEAVKFGEKYLKEGQVMEIGNGAKVIKYGGRVFLVAGLVIDTYDVATSDNIPRAATGKVGAWGVGIASAEAGCAIVGGALVETGPGAVAGCVVGGIVGGIGGYVTGENVTLNTYDSAAQSIQDAKNAAETVKTDTTNSTTQKYACAMGNITQCGDYNPTSVPPSEMDPITRWYYDLFNN